MIAHFTKQSKLEWGPNTENFEKKFTKQSKLGWGPNKEAFEAKGNGQRKLGWGPSTEKLAKSVFSSNDIVASFCL
ncbi:hypothetical protein HMPREF2552_07725 [Staphylococcus sp. HMSC062E10]|nr:hypothetical protein HMPREF2552_07725 [Staphylococcus sp. HMSC062E10]OHP75810.1 hypothetical protein HMPREF2543_08605 [Staphylococcus sp. HMSC062E08]